MARRRNKRIFATEEEKVVVLDLSHLAYLITAHDLRNQTTQESLPPLLTAKEQITCDKLINNAIDKAWLALYGKK